jgi:hypothetical protein
MFGPTGEFPKGRLNSEDRGSLCVSFTVLKDLRIAVMSFGTELQWLAFYYEQTKSIVTLIRKRIIEEFGELSYDKSTLPIKVINNREKNIIEIHLPKETQRLAANPEMWLALAEVIEDVQHTGKE